MKMKKSSNPGGIDPRPGMRKGGPVSGSDAQKYASGGNSGSAVGSKTGIGSMKSPRKK